MKIYPLVHAIAWSIGGILLFLWLEQCQAHHYIYLEQFRLFHYSTDYLTDLLSRPNGGMEYLASYLTQFFAYPHVGALVHTLLFLLSCIFLQGIWRKLVHRPMMPLACMLPGLLLILVGMDTNYHLEGTLAFVLTLLVLNLYIRLEHPTVKGVFMAGASWFLFHLAGPAFVAFLTTVLLHEGYTRSMRPKYLLLYALVAVVPAIDWYHADHGETARMIFLPDAYTNPRSEVQPILYIIWLYLPVLFVGAYLCKRFDKETPRWIKAVSISIQLVIAAFVLHYGNQVYNPSRSYLGIKMDTYSRLKEADKLLSLPLRPHENILHACYQNLALAQKGILADKALKYRQSGIRGLWIEWNSAPTICTLLSDLFYTIGHIALSQRYAFEGLIASEWAVNPYLTLRLIQTNLIFGQYQVAEKYICLLEDTRYREQASSYRPFLYNDKAIEEDPELGSKRKSIAQMDGLSEMNGLPNDLLQILNSNPDNRQAFAYLGMFILFQKDIPMFMKFIETYQTAEGLQPMPLHFQEAVILSYEAYPEKWTDYGVTEATIKRFEGFKRGVLDSKKNPTLVNKLRHTYGDTYWYYYIYNK